MWFGRQTELTPLAWAVSGTQLFLLRLAGAALAVVVAAKYGRIPFATFGIRPSKLPADLSWSLRACGVAAGIGAIALLAAFAIVSWLGIEIPLPPQFLVELFAGDEKSLPLAAVLALGVLGALLIPVTEELIYRSLLLPPLTARLGLDWALALSSVLFGLAHTIPYGASGIPLIQMIGGLVMATGFAIRWSIVPAIIIHLTGNLFIAAAVVLYTGIFVVTRG